MLKTAMPPERPKSTHVPQVRKGQGSMQIPEEEFRARLRERFYDPSFDKANTQIETITRIAWQAYDDYRKSPRTRPAGRILRPLDAAFRAVAADPRCDPRRAASAR